MVLILSAKRLLVKLYDDMQALEDKHTYHILRHSFGTDLFYSLCKGRYETITTASSEYIEVARRMGHNIEGQRAPETTKKYIRSCAQKDAMLGRKANV